MSLILAIFFAERLAKPIRGYLLERSFITDTFPDYILTVVCYILAFAAIILVFHWLGKLLHEAIKVTPAKGINHFLGGILGVFKWVIFLSLIFTLLIVFDPNYKIINKQTRQESVLFNKIGYVVPTLYPYVKKYMNLGQLIPSDNKEKKNELPSNPKEDIMHV